MLIYKTDKRSPLSLCHCSLLLLGRTCTAQELLQHLTVKTCSSPSQNNAGIVHVARLRVAFHLGGSGIDLSPAEARSNDVAAI